MGVRCVTPPDYGATVSANSAALASMAPAMAQAAIVNTDSSGQVAWTYPSAFVDPPVLSADVLSTSSNQPYAVRILSRTNTAVTLQILSSAALNVVALGLTLLGAMAPVGAGVPVHLVARKAT